MPASKHKAVTVDLNTLFEPWQSGDPYAAATGHKEGGSDLNLLYAPASVGTASTETTGYKQSGTEIAPRFADRGTRGSNVLTLAIDPSFFVNGYNPLSGPATAYASCHAIASHGAPGYTFLWTKLGGSTSITSSGTTTATCNFQYFRSSGQGIVTNQWRCQVTDSIGATTYIDFDVNLQVGGDPP